MLPYRDFYYPLNVFMHILTLEEGGVTYLHYGLFDDPSDSIAAAQERSTELLLSRLPSPPASLLEVGIGLGTTLARLTRLGYDAEGITPDDKQIAMARERYGDGVRVTCAAFETFEPGRKYDVVLFQESSQYIDSNRLFAHARELAPKVVVLDEFALQPLETPGLHAYDRFLAEAALHGYRLVESVDLSDRAAPTVDYFNVRFPRFREVLMRDLGLTSQQVEELVESGVAYREKYRAGVYGYKLLVFE